MLVRFIKNWTLPLAMLAGTLGYFFFADIPFVAPAKPYVNVLVAFLTPLLIFSQLLLTFCKVEVHELKPKSWHGWLLLFQTVSCLIVAVLLVCCPMEEVYREVFEGAMVCLICPTATAAAVITGKLGGSASSLTTYTLLSNLLAAVAVPLVFPLVEPHADITFFVAFLKILSKVFPLLLCPFLLAWFLRAFVPKVHHFLLGFHDAAFYLWAVALAIVSGQTVRSLVNSDAPVFVELLIALAGLITAVYNSIWERESAVIMVSASVEGRRWGKRIRCLPSGWHILILIRYLPSVRDRMCCGKTSSIVISCGRKGKMRRNNC